MHRPVGGIAANSSRHPTTSLRSSMRSAISLPPAAAGALRASRSKAVSASRRARSIQRAIWASVTGSGTKAGSPVAAAKALCMRAVCESDIGGKVERIDQLLRQLVGVQRRLLQAARQPFDDDVPGIALVLDRLRRPRQSPSARRSQACTRQRRAGQGCGRNAPPRSNSGRSRARAGCRFRAGGRS